MSRNHQSIINVYNKDKTLTTKEIARLSGYAPRTVRRVLSPLRRQEQLSNIKIESKSINLDKKDISTDILLEEIRTLNKRIQQRDDALRILRRERRVDNRYANATEAYLKELVTEIKENISVPWVVDADILREDLDDSGTEAVGIIQLSDLHLNELIDLPHNKYDFDIASKRLNKFVSEALQYFSGHNISMVYIAMTGDLINSDRRLDELLTMATNRTRATIIAVELISKVIAAIEAVYDTAVTYVTGNESRVQKEQTYVEVGASDNYDTMIYEILKLIYRNSDVKFIDPIKPDETFLTIQGRNVLLSHGGTFPKDSLGNAIQKIKGKYATYGMVIDYVIFGHYHDTSISDSYARSNALCGANAYADTGLNLANKASQLIHIIKPDGINSIKIDLQDASNYIGFDIKSKTDAYNTKSISKVIKKKTI